METTLIILIIEGGLIPCVWDINEGGARFLYAVKLLSPKDLRSIGQLITIH